jgi:HEAT repeat protein
MRAGRAALALTCALALARIQGADDKLDAAFDKLAETGGRPEIEQAVLASHDKPELRKMLSAKLATVLASPGASYEQRDFAARQLRMIGNEEHVGVIAPLLASEKLGNLARYALEGIRGKETGKALYNSLGQARGLALTGVINSITPCPDPAMADTLVKLAGADDAQIASAAVSALGRLGSPEAIAALEALAGKAATALQPALVEALWLLVWDTHRLEEAQWFCGLGHPPA